MTAARLLRSRSTVSCGGIIRRTNLDIIVEKNTKSARKKKTVPMPISMISKPASTRSDKLFPH